MVCQVEGNDSFHGESLIENPALCRQVRADTAAVLRINNVKEIGQNKEVGR